MASILNMAAKGEAAKALPDPPKNIGKNPVDKEQEGEGKARQIKIGSLVKMIYPASNPLGIVIGYEDDYHVFVYWFDEYSFPVHVQDIDVLSIP